MPIFINPSLFFRQALTLSDKNQRAMTLLFPARLIQTATGSAAFFQGTGLAFLPGPTASRFLQNKTSAAANQPPDFPVTFRTLCERGIRHSLTALKFQFTRLAHIFVCRHNPPP
jgi:hypothetical protein